MTAWILVISMTGVLPQCAVSMHQVLMNPRTLNDFDKSSRLSALPCLVSDSYSVSLARGRAKGLVINE